MAYKKYARECDECGKGMNEGYLIDNGYKYYCSDECLHKNMTPEEWTELYNDGDGDSCWTTWDEDPDEYMVDEDDPAPNKLSVDLRDTLDVDVGFNTVKAVRLLVKQLRDQGLDPDKYEFINWAVTCDVQVKEENKA
jgi:hypothetical protein